VLGIATSVQLPIRGQTYQSSKFLQQKLKKAESTVEQVERNLRLSVKVNPWHEHGTTPKFSDLPKIDHKVRSYHTFE
jgi:hypothetical protein